MLCVYYFASSEFRVSSGCAHINQQQQRTPPCTTYQYPAIACHQHQLTSSVSRQVSSTTDELMASSVEPIKIGVWRVLESNRGLLRKRKEMSSLPLICVSSKGGGGTSMKSLAGVREAEVVTGMLASVREAEVVTGMLAGVGRLGSGGCSCWGLGVVCVSVSKKLIKKTQCRLKILKSKRLAIIRLLKEDIAQLLKNEHEEIAMNKLAQLYVDENVLSIYDMLKTFSEFILLNLSYIRKHKDIPNDINEAISTLVFASARIGDLPELRLIRKLFTERYGNRFVTAATELYPGNLVNFQVKEKFTSQSVPEDVKNRMVDGIVRDYLFNSGQLAIEYKPADTRQQLVKVNESTEVQRHDTDRNEKGTQLPPSIPNMPSTSTATHFTQLSPLYEHNIERQSSETAMLHLENIEEFRSENYQRVNFEDQDKRFFLFNIDTHSPTHHNDYHEAINMHDEKPARKRMRRKKSVSKEKPSTNDAQREIYYSSSSINRRKYQKRNHTLEMERNYFDGQSNKNIEAFKCSLDQPCYFYTNSNQGYDIILLSKKYGDVPPYVRARTMPQRHETEISKEIERSSSLTVEKGFDEVGVVRNAGSPKHVHPKLPDYDEIAAIFAALKKAHLQIKGTP
ncbi:hypothetical protein KSS87_008564 [Heliosperma pusillum]|nr:hypothetical protein KSS87_008564 [Heliosperma pusillum]